MALRNSQAPAQPDCNTAARAGSRTVGGSLPGESRTPAPVVGSTYRRGMCPPYSHHLVWYLRDKLRNRVRSFLGSRNSRAHSEG
jgi:hypothetical protein